MNSLFGAELPTAVNFVIAFVVVLILIAAAAWLVRRFGVTRIDAAARGRQPRLAVIDSAAVDGRRKLVIIRRDNVEHLLMIGGPSDVVVETNIVRATAVPTRDTPAGRNGAEPAPRAALDPTPWPLQPEPAPAPVAPAYTPPAAPAVRLERTPRIIAEDSWQAPAEPHAPAAPPVHAPRPAETLAGLADDLARPATERTRPAPPQPAAVAVQPPAPVADQSLAEMAQRLEAALRRPAARKLAVETSAARISVVPEPNTAAREPKVVVAPPRDVPPKPQAQSPTQTSNDLEKEMATLLGRPGKT